MAADTEHTFPWELQPHPWEQPRLLSFKEHRQDQIPGRTPAQLKLII